MIRRHRGQDRLAVAQLCGIVERYGAIRPFTDEVIAAAVAELHSVTHDAHLLGHAWPAADGSAPMFRPAFPDPWREQKHRILQAAGAEPQPRWWEERAAP